MLSWVQTLAAKAAAASLLVAPAPSTDEPSGDASEAETEPTDRESTISAAEEAWNRGDFLEVRGLLEPLADADPLDNRIERERVLLLLADATLSDSTLPSDERQVRATAHLTRIMDANPSWRLPRKVYSPELFDLYLDVREQRVTNAGSRCEAEKLACVADMDEVEAELQETEAQLGDLQKKYDSQEVAIGEKRTRARALFPLGISHFLNGDRGLGWTFLGAEAAIGVAGLSLLVVRTTVDGCRRTKNFQSGSLICSPRGGTSEDAVVRRRRAEEAMAWMFVFAVVFDVALAQARFKPFEITDRVPRSEVEDLGGSGRKRRRRRRPRATVRPSAGASPQGASLGIHGRF